VSDDAKILSKTHLMH